MRALHDGGNPDIETQSVQAEAIVEALQSQLWSGSFDMAAFSEGVRSACAARKKPAFEFAGIDPCTQLFDSALELNARWELVPFHQGMFLEFPPRPPRVGRK